MEEDRLGGNEMEWKMERRGRRRNGGETFGPEDGGGQGRRKDSEMCKRSR